MCSCNMFYGFGGHSTTCSKVTNLLFQVIVVESATHITMAPGYKANLIRPGEGPWADTVPVASWPLM